MQRLPIITFDSFISGGLDEIPKDAFVHIVNSDGKGTPRTITVTNINGLGTTILTIADLLATNPPQFKDEANTGGVSTFKDLTDTPNTPGTDGQLLVVGPGGKGVVYTDEIDCGTF